MQGKCRNYQGCLLSYHGYQRPIQYGSFWHDILHPFESAEWLYHYYKQKDKIIRAFESVWGRKPTEKELTTLIEAYVRNKKEYGEVLKNPNFVKEIQTTINKVIPRPVREDGIFYWQTVAGIMKFQQLRGIKPTGYLNEATWREMVALSVGNKIKRFYQLKFGSKVDWKLILPLVAVGLIGLVIIFKKS